MHRTWIYYRLLHGITDLIILWIAFALAYYLKIGSFFSTDFPFSTYIQFSFLAITIWGGFLMFTKYYRLPPRSGTRIWFDVFLVLLGGAIAIATLVVSYFFEEIYFSRQINLYIFIFGVTGLIGTQWIFRHILATLKKQEKCVYRLLIIGANRISKRLIKAIEKNPYAPYKVIGVIDPYGIAKDFSAAPILGKLNKLEEVCEKESITAMIQCDAFEHTINLIALCEEQNIKFQFDPALRGIHEDNLRIREVAGESLISFVKRDFTSSSKRGIYKIIDVILRQVFDID